nr:uncharacterized mitochondrial protein AtMg00810-like [Tanacetum cinerariifolium]
MDTPMVEKSKLDEDKEWKAVDPSHYHGMTGTLLYLTASRPDLKFAICMCAWYQAWPTEKYDSSVALTTYADADHDKGVTPDLQFAIYMCAWYQAWPTEKHDSSVALTTYADADHAGCQDTRCSTSGSVRLRNRFNLSRSGLDIDFITCPIDFVDRVVARFEAEENPVICYRRYFMLDSMKNIEISDKGVNVSNDQDHGHDDDDEDNDVTNLNQTSDDHFLNLLCCDNISSDDVDNELSSDENWSPNEESDDSDGNEQSIEPGVVYPCYDPIINWKKMKPMVGMKFESVKQLKESLIDYGVSNGYPLKYPVNEYRRLLVRCGKEETDDEDVEKRQAIIKRREQGSVHLGFGPL